MKKIIALLLSMVMLTLVFSSCAGEEPVNATDTGTTKSVTEAGTEQSEDYDGKLVFDHTMELKYAKCFSVDYYKGGYKLIGTVDGTKLLIVPEGMSVPADVESETIVLQQPISNILVSSTPTTSLINAVGSLGAISLNTYDADSWYIESVKEAITSGKMTYIGNYKTPDYELITSSGCDFAIYSTMLTEDVAEQLKQLGVRILLDQAAEEEHPLARVEWMKLYGAMFNQEQKAEQLVNEQASYIDEISKLENSGKSVAVFYITSKGSLYARNAGDYIAKMVGLAGGEYVLSDMGVGEPGTAKMEMEAFYDGSKDADYIIYIWTNGGKPETLDELLAKSDILADMKAVKEGNVWCTTPDFFQITNRLGDMINDIHLMFEADANTDSLTYLKRLK